MVPGVLRTRVGYCGGSAPNPTYRSIGDHTEAISIDFDPALIGYADLLERFWEGHNCRAEPYSRQYLHAVFARDDAQLAAAEASRQARAEALGIPARAVATRVVPIGRFTLAEGYHQKYRIPPRDEFRTFLTRTYPGIKAFADSTVATRLNAILGAGRSNVPESIREELPRFGLPPDLARRAAELAAAGS